MNRAAETIAAGEEIELPPLSVAALLATYAEECGLSREGFSGPVPISAQELVAWANATDTILGSTDFQTMIDASRIFVAAYHEFDGAAVGPPWDSEDDSEERAAAERRLFDMLMGVGGDNG